MKKQTVKRMFLLMAIVLLLCCGSVTAFMFRQTQKTENIFVPARVDCTVAESFDGTQKSSITVTNTENIPAYLRVRLVTYWQRWDETGEEWIITSKAPAALAVSPGTGWLAGSDSTFYYSDPVDPTHTTGNLLEESPLILAEITEESTGVTYRQVVDVFAEAVQSKPARAVWEAWGVTVDAEGQMISVP